MNEPNVNDTVFFLMKDKIHKAEVVQKVTTETANTSQFGGEPYKSINYQIDKNPCGTQYTTRFLQHELFLSKEDLIQDLIKER